MKSYSKIYLSILFILGSLITYCQSNSFAIHTDKPLYFTGDKIWYKLYYPQEIEEVTIKVLLVNSEGKIMQNNFHKTAKSNFLSGVLAVPYNYKTDQYRLVFNSLIKTQTVSVDEKTNKSTFIDTQEEINLSEIYFPIYNDLSKEEEDGGQIAPGMLSNKSNGQLPSELDITIRPEKSNYNARERINLDIELANNKGASSIAVSVIPTGFKNTINEGLRFYTEGPDFDPNRSKFLVEDIYLKGKVYKRSGREIQLNVIGAYTNQLNTINYTKSNKNGEFTMNFSDFYDKQSIQFLPYEQEIDDFTIKLESDLIPDSNPGSIPYTETIKNFLAENRKRKKMIQHFEYMDATLKQSRRSSQNGDSKANIKYVVDEYEKFNTVYGFFNELITPLQFKKVKGKMKAVMNNPKSTHAFKTTLSGNPLFIIDGMATRNADYAGNLSMSNIESIELYYLPDELRKQFNILGLSGVIKINTLTPLFDMPKEDTEDLFNLFGLQQESEFIPYTPKSNSDHLPYFYSTIYWNPKVVSDVQGKASLSFYHPDDMGTFSIIVTAQDEAGNRGVQVLEYSVQQGMDN